MNIFKAIKEFFWPKMYNGFEIAEDILKPFENRDTEMCRGLINGYLKNS